MKKTGNFATNIIRRSPHLTRRDVLRGISLGALSTPFLACSSSASDAEEPELESAGQPLSCVLYPESTEGPFYVEAPELDRSDLVAGETSPSVTEAIPLALAITFYRIDGGSCMPLPGARVALWQCDAVGVYSALESNFIQMTDTSDSTFLRGYQDTDARGVVRFDTIYPGWYGSRTIHIHFKVRVPAANGSSVFEFTSQIYFDDAVSDRVLASAPYLPGRVVNNQNDQVYLDTGPGARPDPSPPPAGTRAPGDGALLTLLETPRGYDGSVNVGLDFSGAA